MKKTFLSIFLISLFLNLANAEEVKKDKETKKKEISKEDEVFLK